MKVSYHNFPIIKLCQILQDPSKCNEFGVKDEDWKVVLDGYKESHPSPEAERLIEGFKGAFKHYVDHNRFISIMEFINRSGGNEWKILFEDAGLKYTGDSKIDSDYLIARIEKSSEHQKILTARYEKLQKEIDERRKTDDPEPLNISKVYKAIASQSMMGASVPDAEEYTCGMYDAFTELIKEKNNKNG